MIVEYDCAMCGRHVTKRRSPANIKTPPKYCSQKCNGASKAGTGHGIQPNYEIACEQCGVVARVYRGPSALPPRFCSLKCLGDSQKGEGNPAWTGGRHKLSIGYMVVLAPDDPEADSRGYVYEHRLVARSIVGRPLLDGEVVHHIDGDKTNNAPSNLSIFPSQSAHLRHHAETKRARQ